MVVLIARTLFSARSFGCDEDNFGCSCHPHIYVHSRGLGVRRRGRRQGAIMVVLIAQVLNATHSLGCGGCNLVAPNFRTSISTRVVCDCGGRGGGNKDAAMIVLIAQLRYSTRSFGCAEGNFGRSYHPHI